MPSCRPPDYLENALLGVDDGALGVEDGVDDGLAAVDEDVFGLVQHLWMDGWTRKGGM